MRSDEVLDCRGLACPMPIVQLSKLVRSMKSGQILEVIADDPAFERDVKAWSAMSKGELIDIKITEGVSKAFIRIP